MKMTVKSGSNSDAVMKVLTTLDLNPKQQRDRTLKFTRPRGNPNNHHTLFMAALHRESLPFYRIKDKDTYIGFDRKTFTIDFVSEQVTFN